MGAGENFEQQLMRTLCLVILGRGTILGGRFSLIAQAAEHRLHIHVAKPLAHAQIEEAAAAIFSILPDKMADLVRKEALSAVTIRGTS